MQCGVAKSGRGTPQYILHTLLITFRNINPHTDMKKTTYVQYFTDTVCKAVKKEEIKTDRFFIYRRTVAAGTLCKLSLGLNVAAE